MLCSCFSFVYIIIITYFFMFVNSFLKNLFKFCQCTFLFFSLAVIILYYTFKNKSILFLKVFKIFLRRQSPEALGIRRIPLVYLGLDVLCEHLFGLSYYVNLIGFRMFHVKHEYLFAEQKFVKLLCKPKFGPQRLYTGRQTDVRFT